MSRLNIKEASIDELEEECENVLGTPYGHNIIGLICNVVDERFGKEEAINNKERRTNE